MYWKKKKQLPNVTSATAYILFEYIFMEWRRWNSEMENLAENKMLNTDRRFMNLSFFLSSE